jgi:hypothetical protein
MKHGFTATEKDYLWQNTKWFFYLMVAEGILCLSSGIASFFWRPILYPIGAFVLSCAVLGITVCLFNIHLRQLAVNIFNKRNSEAPPCDSYKN